MLKLCLITLRVQKNFDSNKEDDPKRINEGVRKVKKYRETHFDKRIKTES